MRRCVKRSSRETEETEQEQAELLDLLCEHRPKIDVAQRVDELLFPVYEYTAAPPEEQNDRGPHGSFISANRLQRWPTW